VSTCVPHERVARGLAVGGLWSKGQASFAGALGERLHASVVEVAAAVEDACLDPGLLSSSGERLADLARLVALVALERLLQLLPARGGKRLGLGVVDELRVDAQVRTEDGQARPLRGTGHLSAHAAMPARTGLACRERAHARFPAAQPPVRASGPV